MTVIAETCPSCGAPLSVVGGKCTSCGVPLEITGPGSAQVRPDGVPAPPEDPNAPFSMTVADVFFIKGRGVVATGQIATGTVSVGDHLVIEGPGGQKTTKCTGVEMFRKQLDSAGAGANVGLLLDGIDRDDIAGGDRLRHA